MSIGIFYGYSLFLGLVKLSSGAATQRITFLIGRIESPLLSSIPYNVHYAFVYGSLPRVIAILSLLQI